MRGTPCGFRLEDVSVHFGGEAALQSIDLSIVAGEAVGLVGPSGAGKSTLLRVLNGMVRPSAGRVHVDGDELGAISRRRLREVRAGIGFIHQDLRLVPNRARRRSNVLAGRLRAASRSLRVAEVDACSSRRSPSWSEAHETPRARRHRREAVRANRHALRRTTASASPSPGRSTNSRSALLADEPVSSVDPARARDSVVAAHAHLRVKSGLTLVHESSRHRAGARVLPPADRDAGRVGSSSTATTAEVDRRRTRRASTIWRRTRLLAGWGLARHRGARSPCAHGARSSFSRSCSRAWSRSAWLLDLGSPGDLTRECPVASSWRGKFFGSRPHPGTHATEAEGVPESAPPFLRRGWRAKPRGRTVASTPRPR